MSKLKKLIMMANASSDDLQSSKYLTIEALEDGLTVSLSHNRCQYSLNMTDWNNLPANTTTPTINSGNKIYFKSEKLIPDQLNGIGTFTVSKPFNLSGNVMSMLFGDEAEDKTDLTGYDYAFLNLFFKTPVVNVSPNFLPAVILVNSCYSYMFYGCTSLVTAPILPATTLAGACYYFMFQECTSLVTAPELPATTLVTYCYNRMFQGCTSLNYIKMLATNINASNCLNSWVSNVASTGTFIMSKNATWNVSGKNGIPEGWTVKRV